MSDSRSDIIAAVYYKVHRNCIIFSETRLDSAKLNYTKKMPLHHKQQLELLTQGRLDQQIDATDVICSSTICRFGD